MIDATLDAPTDSPPSETIVDAPVETIDPALTCGDAPYARLDVHYTVVLSSPPRAIAGAKAFFDSCKDKSFVSDHDGMVHAFLTKGAKYISRVDATGFMPLRVSEYVIDADENAEVPLFPDALKGILQDWSDSKPMILVAVLTADTIAEEDAGTADAPPAACGKDGIVISVVGHPEAQITYYDSESTPIPDSTLTATTASGVASIAGLTASGELVELTATKPGCNINFKFKGQTGRYPLENGVLTVSAPKITAP